jgi:hypothetical protein
MIGEPIVRDERALRLAMILPRDGSHGNFGDDVELPYEIDPDRRLVTITWPAIHPRPGLVLNTLRRLFADPRYDPSFGIISDRRRVLSPTTPALVQSFVDFATSARRAGQFPSRCASVVAPGQVAIYGMARMTEILAGLSDIEYRVFTSLEDAVAWIVRR